MLNDMAKTKQLSSEQRELVYQLFSDSLYSLAQKTKTTKTLTAALIEEHVQKTMRVLDETFLQAQAFEELRAEKNKKNK